MAGVDGGAVAGRGGYIGEIMEGAGQLCPRAQTVEDLCCGELSGIIWSCYVRAPGDLIGFSHLILRSDICASLSALCL